MPFLVLLIFFIVVDVVIQRYFYKIMLFRQNYFHFIIGDSISCVAWVCDFLLLVDLFVCLFVFGET